jgi:hypothetical protein
MATRLDGLPPVKRGPSAHVYPWGEWADGGAWRITRGEDFHVTRQVMITQIRSHARRHSLSVTLRFTVASDDISFQFGPKGESDAAQAGPSAAGG